jgi:hypothetical protein
VLPIAQAFETIGMAKVAKSAFEAGMLFLREGDGITANRPCSPTPRRRP